MGSIQTFENGAAEMKKWMRWSMAGLVLASGGLNQAQAFSPGDDDDQKSAKKMRVVFRANAEIDDEDIEEQETVLTVTGSETPKYWLGIMLKTVEGDLAQYLGNADGILISEVYEGSPADEAGIEVGDIIIAANGDDLDGPQSLLSIMKDADGKASIELSVTRRGEEMEIEVTPVERTDEMLAKLDSARVNLSELEVGLEGVDEKVREALKKLQVLRGGKEGVNILRLGGPGFVWRSDVDGEMSFVEKVEGKSREVQVSKKDDEPAKIIVKDGDETKEYVVEDLMNLPEDFPKDIKVIVTEAMKGKGPTQFGWRSMPKRYMKLDVDFEDIEEVLDGEGLKEVVKAYTLESQAAASMAREVAEKAREQAMAKMSKSYEAARRIKSGADSEVAELKAELKELRKELEMLRKKIND